MVDVDVVAAWDKDDGRALNLRRKSFIKRFTKAEHRRRPRRWCSFAEIADWCAREWRGSLRDEARRKGAYDDLVTALLDGKFEEDGRAKVLHLAPELLSPTEREPTRIDVNWAQEYLSFYKDDFVCLILKHCWLPAELCRRWFEAQRIDPPGDWFSPAPLPAPDGNARPPEEPSGASRSAQAESRPKASDRAVREFFRDRVANWPDGQPAPNEEADWEVVKNHFAPGLSRQDFRLVRADETPSEWRTQGRRPYWGIAKSAG